MLEALAWPGPHGKQVKRWVKRIPRPGMGMGLGWNGVHWVESGTEVGGVRVKALKGLPTVFAL